MKAKEIKTPRLCLAPLRPEDREDLIAILMDSEVSKTYMVPDLSTEEKKSALFERLRALSEREDRFLYGIFREGKLIGLIHDVSMQNGEIELGYFISPREKNKGYTTEALKAMIPMLFSEGFTTVKAGAFSENPASMRVMEKSGMKKTGQTETIAYRGENHVCVYYAIHREL